MKTVPEGPTQRTILLGLGLGALAFAVYGSLLPFEFESVTFNEGWRRFELVLASPSSDRLSRTDLLANFLLFVPVGFGLAGWALLSGRSPKRLALAGAMVPAAAIVASLSIEFLQVFAPGRIPSRTDIVAQTIGSGAGVVLWTLVGEQLAAWLRITRVAAPADRTGRLLQGYACCWIGVNLAPFDVTVDVGDLGTRLRFGQIALIPFAGADVMSAKWIWDAAVECLGAIPVGLAAALALTPRRQSLLRAASLGVAVVVAVECAQIFIRSHSARSSDVIFAGVGVIGGVILARWLPWAPLSSAPAAAGGVNVVAACMLGMAILVTCGYHWSPFDFRVEPVSLRLKAAHVSLIPFAGYLQDSYLNAFTNLLTKIALAVPCGLAAAFVIARPGWRATLITGWSAVTFALFSMIEVGQFFVASRVPDPTDALVGMIAAMAGFFAGLWGRVPHAS